MIRIRDLRMTYRSSGAEHAAVRGVSIDVEDGKFYTLLGPSGCGKTTTLRCVAGLERPDSGEIVIGGNTVYASGRNIWVEPHNRNIGMVFQSYAIWPHMTVFDNVAFPLRHKRPRPPRGEIRNKVMQALSLVHLDGFETGRRRICRAVSSNASRWRAPWSRSRACCCSTSRCRTSTPSCARKCGWSCARW